jgi:hypothetical protein
VVVNFFLKFWLDYYREIGPATRTLLQSARTDQVAYSSCHNLIEHSFMDLINSRELFAVEWVCRCDRVSPVRFSPGRAIQARRMRSTLGSARAPSLARVFRSLTAFRSFVSLRMVFYILVATVSLLTLIDKSMYDLWAFIGVLLSVCVQLWRADGASAHDLPSAGGDPVGDAHSGLAYGARVYHAGHVYVHDGGAGLRAAAAVPHERAR